MDELAFQQALAAEGIRIDEHMLRQFRDLTDMLVQWNQKMNLTAITDRSDIYMKHYYDSLTAAFYHVPFQQPQTVIDVGAGAGFPSIPVKICFPHLRMTLVDSLKKRTVFLQEVADVLSLSEIFIIHDRAEHVGRDPQHREQYDLCLARAVAKLNVLAEYCLPLVREGGQWIALKGPNVRAELDEAQQSFGLLGGKVEHINEHTLPLISEGRKIVFVRKVYSTPAKYPRRAGLPVKQPL